LETIFSADRMKSLNREQRRQHFSGIGIVLDDEYVPCRADHSHTTINSYAASTVRIVAPTGPATAACVCVGLARDGDSATCLSYGSSFAPTSTEGSCKTRDFAEGQNRFRSRYRDPNIVRPSMARDLFAAFAGRRGVLRSGLRGGSAPLLWMVRSHQVHRRPHGEADCQDNEECFG